MAQLLPFPSARRRRFVRSQAVQMASLSPEAAERHLQRILRVQADTISRRGIGRPAIIEDQQALEAAIRAELRTIGFTLRGTA